MKYTHLICSMLLFVSFNVESTEILTECENIAEKTLSLEYALQMALDNSPFLNASRAEVERTIGEKIQSGAYPNPYFAYSVENIFGNKHWKGWDAAETRYELAQPIIIGSKREHRKRAAAYEYSAAVAEYSSIELSLFNELKRAFLDVAAAQELLQLAKEQQTIANEILNIVQDKVDAGKVSPVTKNKTLLEKANRDLNLQKAYVDLGSAKKNLSLLYGSVCPEFSSVVFPFFEIESPGCFEECQETIQCHPKLIRARYIYLAAKEKLRQERAERIPDVTVTIGYKSERECGERGMILGAALPLPIFDYNTGNVHKAESEVCQVSLLASEIELKLGSRLSILHAEAVQSYREVMQLKTEILQLAEESFAFAKEGYEEGKFEYLDLLDAQRSLFEVQERYILALLQFLKKKTDIEYMNL